MIYQAVIHARKGSVLATNCTIGFSVDEGNALLACRESAYAIFPEKDGFVGHQYHIVKIYDEDSVKTLEKIIEAEKKLTL